MKSLSAYLILTLIHSLAGPASNAQFWLPGDSIRTDIIHRTWNARWITFPHSSATEYGVYYFKTTLVIDTVPDRFVIHVSADNRYELYVNGTRVSMGPAWGDLQHWKFESLDISSMLQAGSNTLLARVVNFGEWKAVSQFSYKTAFILQGDGNAEEVLNTDPDTWWVRKDPSYRPIPIDWRVFPYYYAAFPCDTFEASKHFWDEEPASSGKDLWSKPGCEGYCLRGTPRKGGHYFGDQSARLLVPRKIPLPEERIQYFKTIDRVSGDGPPAGFLSGGNPWVIPAETRVRVLLDQEVHTRAYPELHFSGGKGSSIKLEYAEALVDPGGIKGHRDSIRGKEALGYYDIVLPDGGGGRRFRPTWHRVFRYIEMEIHTGSEPLSLDSVYSIYTAYPFEKAAAFTTSNPDHEQLFEMGWRTLRNCTGEVFEDGPYYEQLMYAGDMRVESLVAMYMSGDTRMSRNAIELFDHSRIPEGLTLSRYPSHLVQINPQYSLAWIQAIHDHWIYSGDTAFTTRFLPGIRSVIEWHLQYLDQNGMLGVVPWLRHIEAKSGTPRKPELGNSAQLTLFLSLTLQKAAEICHAAGLPGLGETWTDLAGSLSQSTYKLCWNEKRMLLADTPEKETYTQHANVLGLLTDAIPLELQKEVMYRVLSDTSLVQSYLFFRLWLFEALVKSDMEDQFLMHIGLWENLLDFGFTTFPEFQVESRSDCHAWSTHINYFFLTTVAGIHPEVPGWKKVIIKPAIGSLDRVSAAVPTPLGTVSVDLDRNSANARIIMPEGMSGSFLWNNRKTRLNAGMNILPL